MYKRQDYEGTAINPTAWNINVSANRWNSLAFLGGEPTAITSAIPTDIHDSISIVQTSSGGAWIPSLAVNTIGDMLPGVGYQYFLSADNYLSFAYQANGVSKTGSYLQRVNVETQHFSYRPTGLPYTIIIEQPTFEGQPLFVGDEIAVYDGDLCVGAAVYNGEGRLQITAWRGNEDYKLPGFAKDNPIQIRVYSVTRNAEAVAEITPFNNSGSTFANSGFAHFAINAKMPAPGDFSATIYPNPFAETAVVEYQLPEATDVYLRIYDLSGKTVRVLVNENQEAGIQKTAWNGQSRSGAFVPNGVYFYELRAGENQALGKLILMK